jgi:ElaB/YqjD/DUF883 family membrane-anchored ribosome-binding protein
MSDNVDTVESLLSQVEGELKKGERESVKAKLKDILKKRRESEKTIRLLDLEAKKLVEDFNNGVL